MTKPSAGFVLLSVSVVFWFGLFCFSAFRSDLIDAIWDLKMKGFTEADPSSRKQVLEMIEHSKPILGHPNSVLCIAKGRFSLFEDLKGAQAQFDLCQQKFPEDAAPQPVVQSPRIGETCEARIEDP